MLSFRNLALRRGNRQLFGEATFTIHAGNKIGITGANGAGKSSLFALLLGEIHADSGDLSRPPRLVTAHVAQETPALDRPAIEYVMDGDKELSNIQTELNEAETEHRGAHVATLHAKLDAIDGYRAQSRAARLMHGLGFTACQDSLPVRSFSGGWRMRLNLAQALMCRSDLLLLDEPTNHLDLDAVIWLEQWLQGYAGTLLLISHDRDFIDSVVNHVAHIENGTIRLYSGNYSEFEKRRAADLAHRQSAYEKQKREIAHIHRFVERFRAKATKARQAQSRLKSLERMARIAPAHVDSPFHFTFFEPDKTPNPLLCFNDATLGYDNSKILSDVKLSLVPGDRIGLLGPNGAGKSTLIKSLAGKLAPLAGSKETAPTLRIGYFAQHQLEELHPDETPLEHLQRLDPDGAEQSLRDYLGGFGFIGDTPLERVAPLSGGEKARLVLALIVYQRPNLLLLDEPTNHLDLEMRHALNVALQDYSGAMLIVSHDRHLLRSVSDRFWLVAEGAASPFEGDLDDYRQWLLKSRKENEETETSLGTVHSAAARKDRKRLEAQQRQRLKPLKTALQDLETRLTELNEKKSALEQQLSDPALYDTEKERLKPLLVEQARIKQAISDAEERWLDTSERLEAESKK